MERRWRRGALALGILVSLAGFPAPAWAQSDPPADPLVGSLLTADDLPPGLGSQGIDEPPRFDIDTESFVAHGGTRAVGQVWGQQELPRLQVFDFRMELPDAEAAAAYLDAAEPILSEAQASGLAPVMFTEPVGEDGRYYFGVRPVGDVELQMHNFLFRVGPVAARVFIAGQELPEGLPTGIATTAADRIAASLRVPASPAASGTPGASVTPAASGSPDASVTPGASAGPLGDLLRHVPASVRATCDSLGVSGSELAAVACSPASGTQVLYALYGNGIAADGDFAQITATIATPRVETCAEGPFLGVYEVADEVVGQLACWTADGTAYIVATDKRIPLIVFLLGEDGDLQALEAALSEFAPVP